MLLKDDAGDVPMCRTCQPSCQASSVSPPYMLLVRKRCVNWLYLAISWSGPCCPVFLRPVGRGRRDDGPTESPDPCGRGSPRSGRGPLGSRHLFVEAARPDTPLVFLRLLFAGGSSAWEPSGVKRRSREKEKYSIDVARTVTRPGAAFLTLEMYTTAARHEL